MKKILLMLFVPVIANANIDSKVDTCKSMIDSNQRLSCYDNLFERKIEVKSDENVTGKWVIEENVSPIDDSKTVTLILNADTPVKVRYDKSTPYLVIRCKENKTELYIGFNVFLGSDRITPTTRIDSEKAVSNITWNISTNHKSMFYDGVWGGPGVKKTTDFIKDLSTKSKYFVQVTPYSENSVNTTFTISGLNEAIKPLRAACGW